MLCIAYMIFVVVKNFKKIKKIRRYLHFKNPVIVLLIFPLLSTISCYFLHGQDPLKGLSGVVVTMSTLIYFVLHIWKVNEKTILRAFLIISFSLFLIQVFQQFNPASAIFGVRLRENLDVESSILMDVRNGMYRFDFGATIGVVQIVLFYFWIQLTKNYSKRNLFFFLCFLISIYLSLTRQIIISSLFAICCSFFYNSVKLKGKMKIMIVFICAIVFGTYYDELFSFFVESLDENINDDSYIRYESGVYFMAESLSSFMAFFFGNGVPVADTSYEKLIQTLMSLGYYSSDVGFIGAAYRYGWVYVFGAFFSYYLVLVRYKNYISPYLKIFIVASLLTSIMMFQSGYILAVFLYLCDININKKILA